MPFFSRSLSLPPVQPRLDSTSTGKGARRKHARGEVETLQAVLRQRKTYYSKVSNSPLNNRGRGMIQSLRLRFEQIDLVGELKTNKWNSSHISTGSSKKTFNVERGESKRCFA